MPFDDSGARTPLLALSGDRLIAVARAPADHPDRPDRPTGHPTNRPRRSGPPRFLGPYGRIFAEPGSRAFTGWNLLGRLPMGMFGISAIIMIAGSRGSYALAGAVTATGLAATALVAPWTARLADRYGQARTAVPATLISGSASIALLLCVRYDAPAWTLFAAYACTATTPNTGGMSRARWAHLFRADPASLHTANSFEQAADEVCFMLGPVLAAFLCTTLFPEAGTLTGALLMCAGTLLFAAQRRTEPPLAPRTAERGRSPIRVPGLPVLLLTFISTGAVFGSMEVATVAFADGQGHQAAAGTVLALQAAGSCAAGLLYGLLHPTGPPTRRFLFCVGAMAALMPLPLAGATGTGSLPVIAGCLLLAGMATAPTMVTAMQLVQRLTPPDRLNEGMTLAVTGLLGGIAAGSATGGWTVQHLTPAIAYAVPAGAAALALATAVAGAGALRRAAAGARGCPGEL
ncbi:MFS transporter [Streptomyces sp. H27-D2]|uniref:MFS transporter n=1 Tax=Streptomyces sp. H27-D2 TaxID=3046304 RepID=UPI002DBAB0B0|nr:MFS transporter [Streptomyces sp. H27-D2]MEC4015079.1 MFS transporter [Streptomyces sp. H27-D2]